MDCFAPLPVKSVVFKTGSPATFLDSGLWWGDGKWVDPQDCLCSFSKSQISSPLDCLISDPDSRGQGVVPQIVRPEELGTWGSKERETEREKNHRSKLQDRECPGWSLVNSQDRVHLSIIAIVSHCWWLSTMNLLTYVDSENLFRFRESPENLGGFGGGGWEHFSYLPGSSGAD